MPLRMAAKIDTADKAYWDEVIKPMVDAHPNVEAHWRDQREREGRFGNAAALLFLVDWPEPFGLVMIEAMACGTPVIAFRCGSVPEVIEHGRSGFIVDTVVEAVEAVRMLKLLDRTGTGAASNGASPSKEWRRLSRHLPQPARRAS